MPNIGNTEAIARKILPLIYIIDTSGSMYGEKIGQVNEAMRELGTLLTEISNNNPDAEVQVGVITFASDINWITNGLEKTDYWVWNDIVAGGCTELGSALQMLDSKLSRRELFNKDIGYNMPVLIFMTDGAPTDDYQYALNLLNQNNKWFKNSIKIGIAIGDDADKDVIADVVGTSEAVINVNDNSILKKLIKKVSATSSKIGSKSHTESDAKNASNQIIAQTINEIKQEDATSKVSTQNATFDDSGW